MNEHSDKERSMNIAIVGYGKMGHMVEAAAKSLGHTVAATIDTRAEDATARVAEGDGAALADVVKRSGADGVIEFSHPSSVAGNIRALLPLRLPLVVGTTGWKAEDAGIRTLAAASGGTAVRSANFSLGVNLFYRIVSEAARIVSAFGEYDCAVWEAHHNQKADSPSGTAMEIARRILAEDGRKTALVTDAFTRKPEPHELHVSSTRIGSVPGTHTVFFDSGADTIELTHRARSREGFARGAVHALARLSCALEAGTLKPGALYGAEDIL
jgi:4-hydroxy-tetrahydrodipicolinate reductase